MFDSLDLPTAEAPARQGSPIENLGAGLPPGTLARLTTAHIRLVGMTWNDHYGYWIYQLRANWDGFGERTLSKTAQGVIRIIEMIEARR
jgi:hypothetical protein